MDAPLSSTAGGTPHFLTTRWTVVASAGETDGTRARAALAQLYRLYCYPVYAFIRRRGYCRFDAQDLTQDFFVHLLEKAALRRADPRRGRFRSFLLGALDHFLAHAAERARAKKRGEGCELISLDDPDAEAYCQRAASEQMTAEKLFDVRWAAVLVKLTVGRLRAEMEAEGKGHLFELLQVFLPGADEEISYGTTAESLGLSLAGVKTAVHRLRARYRALLREEVARTVTTTGQIDEELRHLHAALSSR